MKRIENSEKEVLLNLKVDTFEKDDTHVFMLKQKEKVLSDIDEEKFLLKHEREKKVKNLKLLGKVIILSALCVASGKTYKLVDTKIAEKKEDMAMDDYYKPLARVIAHNKEFIPDDDGKFNEDRYAYHYDKIGEYIDDTSEQIESIYSQNKYVEAKDFYIASATKYFRKHYGSVDEIVSSMKSTGDNTTLNDYVETLGYSSVDDYVNSIYEINYSFKQNGINPEKVKTLK